MVTYGSDFVTVGRTRPRSGSLPVIITPAVDSTKTLALPDLLTTKGKQKGMRTMTESDTHLSVNSLASLARPRKSQLSKSLDHLPPVAPRQRKISLNHQIQNKNPIIFHEYGQKHFLPSEEISEYGRHTPDDTECSRFPPSAPIALPSALQLPPLPSGSLTFQSVMREFHHYNNNDIDIHLGNNSGSSGDESATDDVDHKKERRRKHGWTPRLAWYGPIVEYKGHHIFLSTLNSLQVTRGRYSNQKWCA